MNITPVSQPPLGPEADPQRGQYPGGAVSQPGSLRAPQVEDDAELDLADLLAQLLARKWTILLLTLVGGLIGTFNGQLGPEQYQATTVVQVEERSTGAQLPSELIGELLTGEVSGNTGFATEVHIINSRLILGPVVDDLEFHHRVIPVTPPVIGDLLLRRHIPFLGDLIPDNYVRAGESIELSSLIVKEDRIGSPIYLRVTGPDTYEVSDSEGARASGIVGIPLTLADHTTLGISELSAPAGREFILRRDPVRVGVSRLRNGLRVSQRSNSNIVDFRFVSSDPLLSIKLANAIVSSYQDQNLARRSATIDQSIAFIETQLPEIRTTLAEATEELSKYRQERQTEELSLGTQELLQQAVEIETALEELAFREEQIAQRLTPNHPDYKALLAERDRLERRREELRLDLGRVPEAEQELAALTQSVERARQLETQLVNRVEQLRILKASTVGNIRILEQAESASRIGPDRTFPAIVGGGIAFVLASLLILAANFLRRGIEDARAIEQLGLSLFGTINRVKGLQKARAGQPVYALASSDPQSLAVESIRGLRTGLQFSLAALRSKSVMLTSCAPSDGKSFIALNLAIVSSGTGNRVLLIDADLRRGELRRHFGIKKNKPGLSDFLAGSASWEDVLYRDENTGIDFVWTGKFPPNPSEMLATSRFSDTIREAEKKYDLVIVDAPPALAVTDPGIIGQSAGLTLLVVSHLTTTKSELQSAQKTLSNSGVHVSGVILNQFDQKRSRYGNYGAKYGYYQGGYSYKYE